MGVLRWSSRQVQKVVLVRPVDPENETFEINTTEGTGSEVNVTNPALYVLEEPSTPTENKLAKDVTLGLVRTVLEAIRDRLDFPLPAAQVTDLKSVAVTNQPAEFPLPAAQVTALTPPTTVGVSNMIPAVETGLAKETTLAARASETTLGLIRTVLETIRDTIYRRTDPLPAGANTIGQVVVRVQARTLLVLPSDARTTNGVSAAFDTSDLSRIAVDINVTAVTGTLSPSMRVFVDRQGADGLWYPIWTPAAITTVSTLSTTIGQGSTIAQSIAAQCRFRWEITGTGPSFTFSASVIGK